MDHAGLLLPATLAGRLGLRELADAHLDLGDRRDGRTSATLTLTASALAGGECIELSPGRYQASLWDGCHWIRLGGFSGGDGDRLESERSGAYDDNPPPVVDILPSDVGFFSDRCGTWRLLNAHGGSAAAGPDAPAPVRPRPPAPLYHWFRDR